MNAPPETVVVLIDDDQSLLDLLAETVRGPGRIVDTISGAEGVTAELIALSQPRLVLFNPRVGNLAEGDLRALVKEVRRLTGARFVLMLSDADTGQGVALAKALAADEAISIPVLLRDPLARLVPQAMSAPEFPQEGALAALDGLSANDILSLDLADDVGPAQPVPYQTASSGLFPPVVTSSGGSGVYRSRPSSVRSSASAVFRGSPRVAELARLIDEELAKGEGPKREVQFEVLLDTLGDHNLYRVSEQRRGVFVGTHFPPSVGSPVQLKLSFPWGATFELSGAVAAVRHDSPLGRRGRGGVYVDLPFDAALAEAEKRFGLLRTPLVLKAGELA